MGCWVGEGKESESKDKKGLFVTYNLCRFNQSQGEGEIGLAAPRAKQQKYGQRPLPRLLFLNRVANPDSCVSLCPQF